MNDNQIELIESNRTDAQDCAHVADACFAAGIVSLTDLNLGEAEEYLTKAANHYDVAAREVRRSLQVIRPYRLNYEVQTTADAVSLALRDTFTSKALDSMDCDDLYAAGIEWLGEGTPLVSRLGDAIRAMDGK
jgi:hypothetical protein